ncbi:MAG: Nif3-like dinuclear metal center hexameric protein [Prolixibacteraceae bacterium]|nr:Nif3-like dinuclear metal center hexameric protein [Prolixibacteraceae bacterium]
MKLLSIFIIVLLFAPQNLKLRKPDLKLSANEVIDKIKQEVTCDWLDDTVDTFKTGNPEDEVTGIAVCMFADMKVLKEAVANKCNLIIAHEPTFYNHLDETEMLQNSPVYKEKMNYIIKHKLIIFRFHDHIHMTQPDGIYVGMVDKLGWKNNRVNGSYTNYQFEKQTLGEFVDKLSKTFNSKDFRVIGDKNMKFTKVGLSVGAPGSASHMRFLDDENTEVLVAGESREWETYQYVNDAVLQGKKKAVVFLGHINSEEAGMEYCTRWLGNFIKDIPIKYFENGQVYWSAK